MTTTTRIGLGLSAALVSLGVWSPIEPTRAFDGARLRFGAAADMREALLLARSLGGVISGEHGIGITKLDYLEPAELDPAQDAVAQEIGDVAPGRLSLRLREGVGLVQVRHRTLAAEIGHRHH